MLIGRSWADTSLWLAVTMTSCRPSLSLPAALSASVVVLYKAAMTAVWMVCRLTAGASETVDAVIEPSRRGRVMDGISSQPEDHPEDAKLPRHQISRAFIPPCIHPGAASRRRRLDCLSRTSRPLARAGTLDAHCWFQVCKLYA